MANDVEKLINGMIDEKLYRVHTSYIAKVLSISGNKATIQPLHKTKERGFTANVYSVIQNVPICRFPLKNGNEVINYTLNVKSGDLVLVTACERSLDLSGDLYLPRTGSHHSIQDSIIVAVL